MDKNSNIEDPKPTSVALFLQRAIEEKKDRNPLLSLRSASHKIGISPSQVSRIISGERKVTGEIIAKIADWLQLAPPDTDYLAKLSVYENISSPHLKEVYFLNHIANHYMTKVYFSDLAQDRFNKLVEETEPYKTYSYFHPETRSQRLLFRLKCRKSGEVVSSFYDYFCSIKLMVSGPGFFIEKENGHFMGCAGEEAGHRVYFNHPTNKDISIRFDGDFPHIPLTFINILRSSKIAIFSMTYSKDELVEEGEFLELGDPSFSEPIYRKLIRI